ncbi:MAG: ferritin [Corynebacterium sp.]|uniref:ferritin n=1 Tax=uncultured Corynebacterium sp. TaxID=159447 RepID=UPI0017B3FD6D|nr:ferritin [uncultured Corynebacterium sp.]NLZ57918.1 ferritin [Corynebacterium sp.]
MTIDDKLANAFNNQVTAELEASMVYLQLSYFLDDMGLVGMRDWMKSQSEEELEHAHKFSQHLLDRGYVPQVGDIAPPKLDISTAVDAFEAALSHEQKISGLIRELAALQDAVKDYDSRPLINSFLEEQVEEEATVSEILDRLRIAGDSGSGLLNIDSELGSR